MAPGSLDVGGAEAVDQSDREIAEGGHNLWGEAFAQAGTVKGMYCHLQSLDRHCNVYT